MTDALNKPESESSMKSDPTVDESAQVDPFQEERECAIVDAASAWVRENYSDLFTDGPVVTGFDAFVAGVHAAASLPRVHRIGVFDYESLVECLKSNFERAFPGETMRDPQDAIQRMAAEVMTLRKAEMDRARKQVHDELADAYRPSPKWD
jgi:hypothetical protein